MRLTTFPNTALLLAIVPLFTPQRLDAAAANMASPPCDARCILVDVVTARVRTVTPTISLTGAIEPKFQSNIAFRTNGKITARLVEIGEHVTANQVLAKLDPQEQTANLDTAKATLSSAQALLTQAKVGFQRQESLFTNGYATRPNYDQAQQQLRTQTAAVESAQAALGTAQEQFGYTDLKSGVAGIVTARNAETGQVVQAGQTVFQIAQDGPRDAVFQVYEALIANPSGSKTVTVALQSDPGVSTRGTVREISPSVDSASGTVKVKVGLDTVPERMSLGAAVVGSGDFSPRTAIVLPRGALFRWEDSPAVWLFDPKTNAVSPRLVSIDQFEGDTLVLAKGLMPGEMVVTAGIQFLHPGQIVGLAAPDQKP